MKEKLVMALVFAALLTAGLRHLSPFPSIA